MTATTVVDPTPSPARAGPDALFLDGIEAGYGGATVLRDVTLRVPAGSVTALLGPNGAGKSTLLRTVSGLLTPTAGRIEMAGQDITRWRPHRRAAAGLCHVPEGRGIFRSLTVRDNLLMQAPRGAEDDAIERATSAFPILGDRLAQKAGTLSGGQQQMLAMAAAYVRDPSVVLVDEASLGLAPLVVDEIFTFLEQRRDAGAALLIVDQFVVRALQLAATAYVLQRGRIAFAGTAAELLAGDVFERYLGAEPTDS